MYRMQSWYKSQKIWLYIYETFFKQHPFKSDMGWRSKKSNSFYENSLTVWKANISLCHTKLIHTKRVSLKDYILPGQPSNQYFWTNLPKIAGQLNQQRICCYLLSVPTVWTLLWPGPDNEKYLESVKNISTWTRQCGLIPSLSKSFSNCLIVKLHLFFCSLHFWIRDVQNDILEFQDSGFSSLLRNGANITRILSSSDHSSQYWLMSVILDSFSKGVTIWLLLLL